VSVDDEVVGMAMALNGRPKAYALLVGSGLSSAAGVPTGWQIVQQLITELASATDGVVPSDPEEWFGERYGEAPTYGGVVEKVAASPDDRHALLERFLDGDGSTGAVEPTTAHQAIARLVAAGLISVIVTTNFDDLVEQALRQRGIRPVVIASADSAAGSLPLVHKSVVVVKLHGDRSDPRIRNTSVELDAYEPAMNTLLDAILDSYGLIIAGWSADHDTALRAAFRRSSSRRFSTFWTHRSPVSPAATELINARQATPVQIVDLDSFLGGLADAAIALQSSRGPKPLTVEAHVQAAKIELRGQEAAIGVHDRLAAEYERIRRHPIWSAPVYDGGDPLGRANAAMDELSLVAALVGVTAYWGGASTERWWLSEIERFGQRPRVSGSTAFIDLLRLPAAVTLWAAGIAACASERWGLLARLTEEPLLENPYRGTKEPAIASLGPATMHGGTSQARFFHVCRVALANQVGIGLGAYVDAWERWQYLQAVRGRDLASNGVSPSAERPLLRVDSGFDHHEIVVGPWLRQDTPRWAGEHALVREGAFGGDPARLDAARQLFDQDYAQAVERADWGSLSSGAGLSVIPTGRRYPNATHADPMRLFE
jgi:hypothetical protein